MQADKYDFMPSCGLKASKGKNNFENYFGMLTEAQFQINAKGPCHAAAFLMRRI
jgi:hypothetical protein